MGRPSRFPATSWSWIHLNETLTDSENVDLSISIGWMLSRILEFDLDRSCLPKCSLTINTRKLLLSYLNDSPITSRHIVNMKKIIIANINTWPYFLCFNMSYAPWNTNNFFNFLKWEIWSRSAALKNIPELLYSLLLFYFIFNVNFEFPFVNYVWTVQQLDWTIKLLDIRQVMLN